MVDIHCHIIPNIDDGAKSQNMGMDMLSMAEKEGINKIIATPHFLTSKYNNNFDVVEKCVHALNMEIKKNNFKIQVFPGQEIYLDKHVLRNFREGRIKGLNETRYMLLELPWDFYPDYALDIIYELRILGMIPIIAHPERYPYIISKPILINEFINEGCLFQITSLSITGGFGRNVRKTAEKLLINGIADFIASDAHGLDDRRPQLKSAYNTIEKRSNSLVKILMENSEKLLMDKIISMDHEKLKTRNSIVNFINYRVGRRD